MPIVDNTDWFLAFWDGKSKGAKITSVVRSIWQEKPIQTGLRWI